MSTAANTLSGLRSVTGSKSGMALMLLAGAWFFLVFPTEPLYFENQNTKFLHGMALADIDHLDQDWTAGTIDVMPVFTGIVYLLHVAVPPAVIYLAQIALFSVFLYAVVQIAIIAAGRRVDGSTFSIVIGLLVVASQFSNGGARVWGGVAQQYLLGPALEPQSFGVFFMLAVVWFLRRRTEAALWLTALPALIHPGYVVPAGALILGFLAAAWLSQDVARRPRPVVIVGAMAAAGASLIYLGLMILPTSAETWQAANEILAKIRIPRHAVPAHWFDVDAGAKVAGLLLALWLVRQRSTDLFWVMAVCLSVGAALTILAALADSNELGMISPWRISVYLVPLGLAVLLGRLVDRALRQADRGAAAPLAFKVLGAALTVLALAVTIKGAVEKVTLYGPQAAATHVTYMRETGEAETLYLTDPFDMNIRLQSGLPQLVSWKTHPYKDVEVLEWYRRFLLAERVFAGVAIDCAALSEAIDTYGVNHLLLDDTATTIACADAIPVFGDEMVRIYSLGN